MDDSLLDAENLPEPDVTAVEIAADLVGVLEQIEEILGELGGAVGLSRPGVPGERHGARY